MLKYFVITATAKNKKKACNVFCVKLVVNQRRHGIRTQPTYLLVIGLSSGI